MDKKLIEIVKGFRKKRALVVGDVMLDRYECGTINRQSPEAKWIPILSVDDTKNMLGGAGNAATNLAALGAKTTLIGVIGRDYHGSELQKISHPGLETRLVSDNRETTTKIRRVTKGVQFGVRSDYETPLPVTGKTEEEICKKIKNARADFIVVSDYAKGVVTEDVYATARDAAKRRGIPLFVDPKPRSFVSNYDGATIVKFNNNEACEFIDHAPQNGSAIELFGRKLIDILNAHVVITRAEKGASIFYCNNGKSLHIPTRANQNPDVSGAGDTFIATMALAYGQRKDNLEQAANLANIAAGIKCGKVGAVPVSREELLRCLSE